MRTLAGPQAATPKEALTILIDRLFDAPDPTGSDRAKVLTGTWADSVHNGQKAIAAAGTAEALAGSSTPLQAGVVVKALAGNTTDVYVGGSGVTAADGHVLAPGQETPLIAIDDLSKVYVDVATAGEGVSFIAS